MSDADFNEWHPMESAPKDGTRVLVEVRASEQGPAEVDVARWSDTERSGDGSWIAADSDPGCVIAYAEAELLRWMPLPSPLPKLRTPHATAARAARNPAVDEIGGSGI